MLKRRVASLFGGAKYRASSFAPHRVNMLRVKHFGLYQGNPEGMYAFDGDAARGSRYCVGHVDRKRGWRQQADESLRGIREDAKPRLPTCVSPT